MKKTLHLNLVRKWFDMIKSGEKKEEYRSLSHYWISRLIWDHACVLKDSDSDKDIFIIDVCLQGAKYALNEINAEFAFYSTVTFSNGYSKNRDQFEIELKGISIKEGNPDWGAIPGKKYFVLELGEIL